MWYEHLDHERFNAGILALQPDMGDFVEIIASYRNHSSYQWEGHAEQVMCSAPGGKHRH